MERASRIRDMLRATWIFPHEFLADGSREPRRNDRRSISQDNLYSLFSAGVCDKIARSFASPQREISTLKQLSRRGLKICISFR